MLPDELKPIVRNALEIERKSVSQQLHLNWQNNEPCQRIDAIPCPPNKYRRPSGECNNIRHAKWGNRGGPFLRLLPPNYADGNLIIFIKYIQ